MISLVCDHEAGNGSGVTGPGDGSPPGPVLTGRSERQVLLVLVPQGVDGPVQVVDRHLGAGTGFAEPLPRVVTVQGGRPLVAAVVAVAVHRPVVDLVGQVLGLVECVPDQGGQVVALLLPQPGQAVVRGDGSVRGGGAAVASGFAVVVIGWVLLFCSRGRGMVLRWPVPVTQPARACRTGPARRNRRGTRA